MAGLAEGLDAEPDQIERADKLEQGKKLRAGKDHRRYAKSAADDMDKSAQCCAEGRGDSGLPASRQRPGGDVEDGGTGNGGNDQGCQQEQREVVGWVERSETHQCLLLLAHIPPSS